MLVCSLLGLVLGCCVLCEDDMKEQRWYKIENNQAFIFDSGYENKSQSVSVVPISDLQYYRNNFNLKKLWG